MTLRTPAALFLCACVCACAGRNRPGASADPTPFSPVTATYPVSTGTPTMGAAVSPGNLNPITAAATPTPLDRPLYQIHATLDTNILSTASGEMIQLAVQEQVTYTHRAWEPVQELILQFEPSWRRDLFFLSGLSSDRAARDGRAEIADGRLRIALENPLPPGESVVVRLDYRRFITREPELIGYNDLQILLGNWYAFFPPYRDGEGWLARPPGKVGEYLNYPYADFDVQLEILGDDSYRVAASGIPDGETSPIHYRFTGRSFAVALTKQTLFRRTAGPVEVLAFARPDYGAQGNFMADTSAQAMTLYSEIFGQYPHPRLTVLESELEDGMEFDGLVFLSPALFEYFTGDGKDYLTAVAAHETAHEWWYGRVGNDQAMDPWLDEAFAVYSELLFYEKYYPGYLEWWWWTRVDRYPSTYCVDQSIYAFTTFRSYVNTVYLRGATMLHKLRQSMGKADFMESLRELQTAGFGSVITPADVFRVFQAHSSVPLSGVWKEYLCQPVPLEGA